jgi:hypothetical protein
MSRIGFVIGLTPGVACQHDMDSLRILRGSEPRRDLAVTQPTRHTGQGPQMRGIVAIGAEEQERQVSWDIIRRAEVQPGLEAREDANGLLKTGKPSMGDSDAAPEAKSGGFAAFEDCLSNHPMVQGGFRRSNAGHHVNGVPHVVCAQTGDHALRGDQGRQQCRSHHQCRPGFGPPQRARSRAYTIDPDGAGAVTGSRARLEKPRPE